MFKRLSGNCPRRRFIINAQLIAALASLASLPSFASGYDFNVVVDSNSGLSPDFTSLGQRKLNDSGEVAFLAQPSFAQYRIYKSSGGGVFTHIAGPPNFFGMNRTGNGAINNSGEVVFTGSTTSFENGIFRGNGTSISTIAAGETNPTTFGPKRTFFATSVSNSGHIAYLARSSFCSGEPVTCSVSVDGYYAAIDDTHLTLAETGDTWSFASQYAPVINDAGQALFPMTSAEDGNVHLLQYDNGSLATVDPDFGGNSGFSMNNFGDVAFAEATAVRLFSDGATTTIADTSDGFNFLMKPGDGEVAINDAGQIAFWGSVTTYQGNPVTWQGIFNGPDIANDRVLVRGDEVMGHTIGNIDLLGMNNAGQILVGVSAQSPDNWRALLVATPEGPAGDFNHDGSVDAADYVVWRKTNGTPAGYNDWRANFGHPTSGTGSLASIPEPATLALLFMALPLAIRRTR